MRALSDSTFELRRPQRLFFSREDKTFIIVFLFFVFPVSLICLSLSFPGGGLKLRLI